MIDTTTKTLTKTELFISKEEQFGAHNYHPLPVVLDKGKGAHIWDVEGKRYYDFLSAYSAVNQGHCHPRIVNALIDQASKLALTSRAFFNSKLGEMEEMLSTEFGFEKVLPMNSGAEAVETAIKLCRKWGYEVKGIPENCAEIIVFNNNFHGRTTSIVSFSDDNDARQNFGPFANGFKKLPYDQIEPLKHYLEHNPNVAGVLFEPIQGEAGVIVPSEGYIASIRALCSKNNVLMIADEIQTGIGRTGKMLAIDHESVQPDILILGKALSGGMYPVSAVLANKDIMEVIHPGQHGSTYGGNPIAAAVTIEALKVVKEEDLISNADRLGHIFRSQMNELIASSSLVTLVRGRGLLNALVIDSDENSPIAWDLCIQLKDKGLLAKPTHGNKIRFAPPLVITENQLLECCEIIKETVRTFNA